MFGVENLSCELQLTDRCLCLVFENVKSLSISFDGKSGKVVASPSYLYAVKLTFHGVSTGIEMS